MSEPSEKLLLTAKESAHLLSISECTLEAWRLRGKGPPWLKLSGAGRGVRYQLDGLRQWIDELTGTP